jgi:hypothetical protein
MPLERLLKLAEISLCSLIPIDEWFPRTVKCGLRFAASKQPDAYFGRLAVSHIQSAAPTGLQCRTFEKLEEAREWLDRDGPQWGQV